MPVWKDSLLEHIYYDGRGAVDDRCEVRIDGDRIFVSYEESDAVVMYEGKSLGAGHYILDAADGDGRATLHMFEGSRILEGFWLEDDYRGFWRITLDWNLKDSPQKRGIECHLRLV